jgi:hypothetical protein
VSEFRALTAEEIAEEEADIRRLVLRMKTISPFINAWRNKPPKGKQEVIECPVCKGKLHLSQAAYNGHVHAHCETANCINFME